MLAQTVSVPGSPSKRTECRCNEAEGYKAVNGDVENCQHFSGKALVLSYSNVFRMVIVIELEMLLVYNVPVIVTVPLLCFAICTGYKVVS